MSRESLTINHLLLAEQFSTECRKTKPNVTNLANHKGERNTMNQSKLELVTCSKARENERGRVTMGVCLTCDWTKKWREYFFLAKRVR